MNLFEYNCVDKGRKNNHLAVANLCVQTAIDDKTIHVIV